MVGADIRDVKELLKLGRGMEETRGGVISGAGMLL